MATHALAPENSDRTERKNVSKFRKKSSKIAEIQLKSFAGAGAKRNPDVCGGGNRGQTYYKSPTGTTDLRPILHVQPPPPRHSYTHLPRPGGVHSRPGPARPVPPEHVLPVHAGARFQNLPVTPGSQLSHVARAMPRTGRVQNPGYSNPRRAGFQKHPVITFHPTSKAARARGTRDLSVNDGPGFEIPVLVGPIVCAKWARGVGFLSVF